MLTERICVFRIDKLSLITINHHYATIHAATCHVVTISHLSFVVSKLFGKGETKSITAPSIAHAGCEIHKWSSRGLLLTLSFCEISLTAQLWEGSRKAQERFRELVNLIFLWLWPRLILTVNTGDRFSRDRDGDRGQREHESHRLSCPVSCVH